MFRERRRLPVFHEKELEEILRRFDLLEKMKNNELVCSICDVNISKDNFGCIYLSKEEKIAVTCSNPECLERVHKETEDA